MFSSFPRLFHIHKVQSRRLFSVSGRNDQDSRPDRLSLLHSPSYHNPHEQCSVILVYYWLSLNMPWLTIEKKSAENSAVGFPVPVLKIITYLKNFLCISFCLIDKCFIFKESSLAKPTACVDRKSSYLRWKLHQKFNFKFKFKSLQPLIVGGQTANENEFPWTALLRLKSSETGQTSRCGGSLISDRWGSPAASVLTLLWWQTRPHCGPLSPAQHSQRWRGSCLGWHHCGARWE